VIAVYSNALFPCPAKEWERAASFRRIHEKVKQHKAIIDV
jgi:hypothetical protein